MPAPTPDPHHKDASHRRIRRLNARHEPVILLEMPQRDPQLVLFDGVCNVCNALILFIIDRDPKERFVFASLSSELGQRVVQQHGLGDIDSVVLVEDGRPYTHSTAVLRILARLRGLWFLTWLLFVVPRFLRDPAYRFFARNRYAWFGKQDVCRVPTPELRRRFVS